MLTVVEIACKLRELGELEAKRISLKQDLLQHRDEQILKKGITDLELLNAEIEKLRAEIDEGKKGVAVPNANQVNADMVRKISSHQSTETREKQAQEFMISKRTTMDVPEIRSLLLTSNGIAKPNEVGTIHDGFNTTSSIVDQVKIIDATGAGTFKEVVSISDPEATEGKTDGTAPTASDAVFTLAEIKPYKVSVLTYVSNELYKQSPIDYLSDVKMKAFRALKTKMGKIVVDGVDGKFTGIKTALDIENKSLYQELKSTVANGLMSATAGIVDENSLQTIIMSYGGDENIAGNCVLYLNKEDLIAFGKVKGADKKSIYEIIPNASNPNTGTIKNGGIAVSYCINSQLVKHSGTVKPTTGTTKTMLYGSPANYELALFGSYDIKTDESYKFAENLIAIKAEVMAGGNLIVKDGFVIVTIPASV